MSTFEAILTNRARELRVLSETEGVVLGDWHFLVGTDGYDVGDPATALECDPDATGLDAPVGNPRPLGLVVDTGGTAAVTGNGAFPTITGALFTKPTLRKWIRIFNAADPNLNGLWPVGQEVDSTSCIFYNPLNPDSDAGPLDWELRQRCVMKPNERAVDFYCRLLETDDADGLEIGEIGVFGRVLASPMDPSLVGEAFLYAIAHTASVTKNNGVALPFHICVQE